MYSNSTLSLLRHVFGQQLLRKRTVASGGSQASVGKSLRERQKSPQVGRDRETCGLHRQVATEVISPAVSRVSGAVVFGRVGALEQSRSKARSHKSLPTGR